MNKAPAWGALVMEDDTPKPTPAATTSAPATAAKKKPATRAASKTKAPSTSPQKPAKTSSARRPSTTAKTSTPGPGLAVPRVDEDIELDKKATYMLSTDALNALDAAWFAARRAGQPVSRERLVDAAITALYGHFMPGR